MPFKSFDDSKIEVDGLTSSLFVIHKIPLMRLGIVNALKLRASMSGVTLHSSAKLGDLAEQIRAGKRGDVIVCDLATWTSLEREAADLHEHVRSQRIAICLVACTNDSAHRLLQLRGVAGVVSAECEPRELEVAVGELAEGKTYFKTESCAPPTGMAKLSSRQIEILELMTRGLLNKQIAWELGVTEGTVKSHVSAILEKLGCDRRTQAIATFLQSLGVGASAPQRTLHS